MTEHAPTPSRRAVAADQRRKSCATSRLALIPVLALLVVVATSCSSGSTTPRAVGPQRGGNLVFARTADSITLNKTTTFDNESTWAQEQIFQTLVVSAPNGRSAQPWLATSWTLSSNKTTWTFHLRPGVKFSNGQTMTAADVKFSLDQTRVKQSGWAFIDAAIASVQTPSPSVVVIHTKTPWAPLLGDLALWANGIVPNNYDGKTAAAFYQDPIGTGPFKLKSWTKGAQMVLVRNTYYWQKGKPYLNSVTFSDVPNDNTRILNLRGGQANVIEFPPFATLASLKTASGVQVKLYPADRVDFLMMNDSKPPFTDVHVRRAIAYAINRQAIIRAVLFGYGTPANSYLPPNLPYYDPASPGLQYNPTKARQELALSKYPHGFTTPLLIVAGDSTQTELAQIVQQELGAIGIKVRIVELDKNAQITYVETGKYSFAWQYWTSDIIDPDELAGALNIFGVHFNDPNVNQLIGQSELAFDHTRRQTYYAEIQARVAQDSPVVFLYFTPYVYAYTSAVHGFYVYPTGNYPLQNVWLSRSG
jgi:peptide/nickel transport system substrate-binding protein